MTLAERTISEAIRDLQSSHLKMKQLMSVSGDWTAVGMINIDYEELERTITEFGRCQCLILPRNGNA